MDDKKISHPHIYGFKTPEWHGLKCFNDDPSPASENRWKRLEFMSTQGYKIFKDDEKYSGAWLIPDTEKDAGDHPGPGNEKDEPKCQ